MSPLAPNGVEAGPRLGWWFEGARVALRRPRSKGGYDSWGGRREE